MIYLIDPMEATIGKCPTLCTNDCGIKCSGVCGIKPCYGINPTPI